MKPLSSIVSDRARTLGMALVTLGLCGVAGLGGGCMRRTIEITSEPTNALVWLNDTEVGRTPLEVDFKFYGNYDVRLAAEGYESLATNATADAPFVEYPGPDLIASAFPIHNRVAWHFKLKPLPSDVASGEKELIARGRAMVESAAKAEGGAGAK